MSGAVSVQYRIGGEIIVAYRQQAADAVIDILENEPTVLVSTVPTFGSEAIEKYAKERKFGENITQLATRPEQLAAIMASLEKDFQGAIEPVQKALRRRQAANLNEPRQGGFAGPEVFFGTSVFSSRR